jgi:Bicoid-interacting protein 3 (Bin3)
MFKQIQIRPDDFERILSNEIGFKIIDHLGTSLEKAKGFQRPILVLEKPLPSIAVMSWSVNKASDMLESDDTCMVESNDNSSDIYGIKRNISHPLSVDYTGTSGISSEEEVVTPPKRYRVDI